MQEELRDVFLIPVEDEFLLHAPLHGVTSLVNAEVAQELRSCLACHAVDGLSPAAHPLGKALLSQPVSPPPMRQGPFAPSHVSLLPTDGCNMSCLYCTASAESGDHMVMSPETCLAALRYQASVVRREGLRQFAVYYFGGEPFLAWDLVQFADSKGRALADECGVSYWSECATNGFMSEEHATWVARHLSFAVVSLDGPAELHDRHRPSATGDGTYETIVRTLRIFEAEGMPYALRCNVDSTIVERVPEITAFFCREFKPLKINLEPLVNHGFCPSSGLIQPEPSAFVNAIVAAGQIARYHGVELKLTTAQPNELGQSNCAVAEDSFIVAPDGLVSACYLANSRKSEFASGYGIGEIDGRSHIVNIDPIKLDRVRACGVANIPRCQRCFAKWHCAGGCRLFHTPPQCEEPSHPMCQVTQRLTLWRLLEHLRQFERADRIRLESSGVAA